MWVLYGGPYKIANSYSRNNILFICLRNRFWLPATSKPYADCWDYPEKEYSVSALMWLIFQHGSQTEKQLDFYHWWVLMRNVNVQRCFGSMERWGPTLFGFLSSQGNVWIRNTPSGGCRTFLTEEVNNICKVERG